MRASTSSWKNIPFSEGVPIAYDASFSPQDFERLQNGLIPLSMDDKWLIFHDEPYLFFHRSWTGKPVYRLKIDRVESEFRVSEALWANEFAQAEGDGLLSEDPAYQCQLLDFLVSNFLLGKTKSFPIPKGLEEEAPGVVQHHVSGSGFPESTLQKKPWWKIW
jgi:hypothetical protein